VRQVPVSEKARHFGYKLTAKGEALKPLLRNMRDWGLEWQHGTSAATVEK
jgi:DNA-binding HxlR family transcriptional regulator